MSETLHYIRCTHCGYLNPFKTEYLTLCESCGRKLLHNFPDWQKNHPGKTVVDFNKEVCVLASEHSNHQHLQKPDKRIFNRSFLSWLIAALFGLLLGIWIWYPDKETLFKRKTIPEQIMTTEWIWQSTGQPPMLISLPEKPEKQKVAIPELLSEFVEHAETYGFQPATSLKVTIDHYRFKTGITPSTELVAHAVMKQMAAGGEIRFTDYRESPTMYLSARGISLEGAYQEKGKYKKFRFVIYTYRNAAYVVRTVFLEADPNAVKAAERIMDSVEIDTEMKWM